VPLIVSWAQPNPQNPLQAKFPIPANSVEHDIVTCVDMMPTLLKIAGANIPKNAVIDGHDISPYFMGMPGPHRPQEFLTHFPHRHRNTLFSTYRTEDWKIVYSYASAQWELYNLADDPFERSNVVKDYPDRARSLARQMVEKLDAQDAMYPVTVRDEQPVKPEIDKL